MATPPWMKWGMVHAVAVDITTNSFFF